MQPRNSQSHPNTEADEKRGKIYPYELIFHVGANKTGSSAIQNFIRINRKIFNQLGFQIPSQKLTWSDDVSGYHVFQIQQLVSDPEAEKQIDAVFSDLISSRTNNSKILISAENLSHIPTIKKFRKLCVKYKTKIIIYIRRQDEFITSSWQQWHSKRNRDFNAWLPTAIESLGHWENIINVWEHIVGKDSVSVRLFEHENFPDGNILKDFLDVLGLGARSATFSYPDDIVNPSYSDIITPLVSGNTKIFSDVHDNDFYKMVGNLTGESYVKCPKVSLMSREQREHVAAVYAEENNRLCARFFPERRTLFKPVDHTKYLYYSREEMLEEQVRFLTRILFELGKKHT